MPPNTNKSAAVVLQIFNISDYLNPSTSSANLIKFKVTTNEMIEIDNSNGDQHHTNSTKSISIGVSKLNF